MATRTRGAQSEHDAVVAYLLRKWSNPKKWSLDSNPDGLQNLSIGPPPVYPDLIAHVGAKISWIAEVETPDSVTDAEVSTQWKDYASRGVDLNVVVPSASIPSAKALAKKHGVAVAAWWGYRYSILGGVSSVQRVP